MSTANPCYVHAPFPILLDKLPLVAQHHLNVEILFAADYLDKPSVRDEARVRDFLQSENLRCTFHGPFMDLSPGAFDSRIREVTLQRFLHLLDIAK